MAGLYRQKGTVLILTMIFLAVISVAAVSLAAISTSSLQCSNNQQKASGAYCAAMSGTEILHSALSGLSDANGMDAGSSGFMSSLASYCRTHLPATVSLSDPNSVEITGIVLSEQASFSATITKVSIDANDGDWALQVDVTGHYGLSAGSYEFGKTVRTVYAVTAGSSSSPVTFFDGAIASKGAVNVTGNAKIFGYNNHAEANVFIDADTCPSSFYIDGSSAIGGTVSIVNDDPTLVTLTGAISINEDSIPTWWSMRWGGPFDDDDVDVLTDCHVSIGVDPIEFPVPNPTAFKTLAPTSGTEISGDQSNTTKSNVQLVGSINGGPYTINNIYIPANTNPSIGGLYTINGIIYIEQPNVVTFGGSITLNGVIIAAGDYENPDPTHNSIIISGDATNNGVNSLDMSSSLFSGLSSAEGIAIMAPGFLVDIGASYDAINGGIACNGISFTGNPQVFLGGPLINYSTDTTVIANSTCLTFDLSGYQGELNSTAFTSTNTSNDGMAVTYLASAYREL